MKDYRLTKQELAELRGAHRAMRKARKAYRFNAVFLLGSGWSAAVVATALLLDDDTVRNHFKRYKRDGLPALERMNYTGSEVLLASEQLAELDAYLQKILQVYRAFPLFLGLFILRNHVYLNKQLSALRTQ